MRVHDSDFLSALILLHCHCVVDRTETLGSPSQRILWETAEPARLPSSDFLLTTVQPDSKVDSMVWAV